MDIVVEGIELIKISAFNKLRRINKDCNEITIGPNCSVLNTSKVEHNTQIKDEKTSNKTQDEEEKYNSNSSISPKAIAFSKLLVEDEVKRRNEVQMSMQHRLASTNAAIQKINTNCKNEWLRRQQKVIEQNRQQETVMLKILQEHEQQACDISEKLHLQYQKQQEERHKRNLELQNREHERQQLKLIIGNIASLHSNFKNIYQEIVSILKSCTNPKCINKILANNASIKTLPDSMDKIREKCKENKVTLSDLQTATTLVEQVTKLRVSIASEVEQINEQERTTIEQEKLEAEKSKVEQEKLENQKQEQLEKNKEQKTATVSDDYKFVSKENLHMFAELQQFLDSYETNINPIVSDPKCKQFKFACQKAVNIPLNAISSVNKQHLEDKYQRLCNLLLGNTVEAGGTSICAAQHPQGIAFCTNLLAQKFVLQGDLIVSSNPASAQYFAAVLTALWINCPDFGKLVLAHFHREVPYLVPMYPVMLEGESNKEYYKRLGYRYNDDVVERQDQFLKRMSGTMRLYSAILISKLKMSQQDKVHPHGLAFGWRWLASILNLEPSAGITATMIYEFLEVTGSTMVQVYGKQFLKLLQYLNNVFLPKIKNIDSGGPVSRLEDLVQKACSAGTIDPPKGILPEGFW